MVQPKLSLVSLYDSMNRLMMIRECLLMNPLEAMPSKPTEKEINQFYWLIGLCDDCFIEEISTLRAAVDNLRDLMNDDRS